MRRAKIIATIGPASNSLESLHALLLAGVDVVRINMSHGSLEEHGRVIRDVRHLASDLDRQVAIMLDLSGPKIRTGKLRQGKVLLKEGALITITSSEVLGDAERVSSNYPLLPAEVRPGDRILLSDGEIELQVCDTSESELRARVVYGGILGEHKGINLPGAKISIPSLTDKDTSDLRFGIANKVDLVAQSFVRSAADCRRARELIAGMGGSARLIAKIEKPEAVADLGAILQIADGVMVARGDLAVETSPEEVPVLQKKIISEALLAERTVITATQMLQSMIGEPRPTRAEASDVANAILDGSDALMLSGETAVGRYPLQSVKMMDRIIRSAEGMTGAPASRTDTGAFPTAAALEVRQSMFSRPSGSYARAIAEAATFAALELDCRLIVVFTNSGHMARRIAALRPSQRVIAFTPFKETYRQLAVTWGVEAFKLEEFSQELLIQGDRILLECQLAKPGEMVVLMAGQLTDSVMSTSMKLHRVGGEAESGS